MEEVNFMEENKKRNLLSWLIVNSTLHEIGSIDKIKANKEHADDNLRVQFTINGIELPVKKSFEEIEKRLNQMIKERAEKLIIERMDEFFDNLYDLRDSFMEHIKEKFGFEPKLDDDY